MSLLCYSINATRACQNNSPDMFQEKRHAIDLKLLDLKEAIKFEIRNLTILNLNQKLILQG